MSRSGSSRPSTSESAGSLCIPVQNASSPADRRMLRMRRKPLRKAAERSAPWRQRRLLSARNRLPCRRKIRHQDAPRHSVNRQMMDRQQQPPGPPPRRHRTTPPAASPGRRSKPLLARPAPPRQCSGAAPPHPDRAHRSRRRHAARIDRAAGRHLEGGVSAAAMPSHSAAAMHRDDRAQPAARRSGAASCSAAGTCSSTAWLNRSIGPPRCSSQCMIGVAGKPPTATSGRRRNRLPRPATRRQPASQPSDAGTPRAP